MAATEDTTTLAKAHGKLTSVQPILQGFNHRNKNQHRTSRWWAQFDMLRRHTHKLAGEVHKAVEAEAVAARAAAAAARARSTKRKKTIRKPAGEHLSVMKARARWLRESYLPRVYLAFTQLSADNQHAALGLLLLGVLAEVNAAVAMVLSDEAAETTTATTTTTAPPFVDESTAILAGAGPPRREIAAAAAGVESAGGVEDTKPQGDDKHEDEDEDMGTAVTRVEAEQEMRRRAVRGGVGDEDGNSFAAAAASGHTKEPESEPDLVAEDQRSSKDKKEKTKKEKTKKKKRKKGGDEFDDLFSSLI